MLPQNVRDGIILVVDGFIQRCSLLVCPSVDVGTVTDQDFRRSFIRVRITLALSGPTHRDGVKRGRADNGILIDVGTQLKQSFNRFSASRVGAPREWRQPPITRRIVHLCAQIDKALADFRGIPMRGPMKWCRAVKLSRSPGAFRGQARTSIEHFRRFPIATVANQFDQGVDVWHVRIVSDQRSKQPRKTPSTRNQMGQVMVESFAMIRVPHLSPCWRSLRTDGL